MSPRRITIGLALVALGGLFLLDQAGYVNAGNIIGAWWPLAIVLVGTLHWLAYPRAPLGPAIVTLVGLVLLVGELGLVPGGVFGLLWPFVLVAIGVGIPLNRAGRAGRHADGQASVDRFVAFGGLELVNPSPRFQGGSLTARFGGITLDLREAEVAPEGATLAVLAAFGGVDVRVPRGWRANLGGLPLFGAIENRTLQDGHLSEDAPTLNVQATALFGGVGVKH